MADRTAILEAKRAELLKLQNAKNPATQTARQARIAELTGLIATTEKTRDDADEQLDKYETELDTLTAEQQDADEAVLDAQIREAGGDPDKVVVAAPKGTFSTGAAEYA